MRLLAPLAVLMLSMPAAGQDGQAAINSAMDSYTDCIIFNRDRLLTSNEAPQDIATAVLSACRNRQNVLAEAYRQDLLFMRDQAKAKVIVERETAKTEAVMRDAIIGSIVEYRLKP